MDEKNIIKNSEFKLPNVVVSEHGADLQNVRVAHIWKKGLVMSVLWNILMFQLWKEQWGR